MSTRHRSPGAPAGPRLPAAAAADWAVRLGTTPREILTALFSGNDDQVLIGKVSEYAWWEVVQERLRIGVEVLVDLRGDLAARERWDEAFVSRLRRLRSGTSVALVSNAWPQQRTMMAESGLLDVADEVVLSCEVGCPKPGSRIYRIALQRLGADPGDALLIDDTAGHVAAEELGLPGHHDTGSADTIARIDRFLMAGE